MSDDGPRAGLLTTRADKKKKEETKKGKKGTKDKAHLGVVALAQRNRRRRRSSDRDQRGG